MQAVNYSWNALKLKKASSPHSQTASACAISPWLCICMDKCLAVTSRSRVGQPNIPRGAPVSLLFSLSLRAKPPRVLEDFTLIYVHWFIYLYIIHRKRAKKRGQELHVDNNSGSCKLGSKGQCLNLEAVLKTEIPAISNVSGKLKSRRILSASQDMCVYCAAHISHHFSFICRVF